MTYTNSLAQSGLGTVVSIGPTAGTGSPTYVAIGEVKSAPLSGTAWKTVDTTNFQSAAEEWLSTILGTGSVTLAGNRVSNNAGQVALQAAFLAGLTYMFEIQLPKNILAGQTTTGDLIKFNALVESLDIDLDTEKEIGFTSKLKVSGAIVITPGS